MSIINNILDRVLSIDKETSYVRGQEGYLQKIREE